MISKSLISFSELDVGDVGVNLLIFAQRQTVQRMVAAVSGELFALEIGWLFSDGGEIFLGSLQHGSEVLVIIGAESFSSEDDLMPRVGQGLGVVPLNDVVRGWRLNRFLI